MKLVDDWREFYKWFSTWLIGLAASAPIAYAMLPTLQEQIGPKLYGAIQTALVLLIFVGRVTAQKPPADPNAANPEKTLPPKAPGD